MSKIQLSYFDAPVSRGEECRLALHLAGVDFEDDRIKPADWPSRKAKTPFGALPVLSIPGQPPLAQANAILVLLGRQHGLHPKDDLEAARHESMMGYVEDLRGQLGPTLRIKDPDEKKRVREELAASYLPTWAANVERAIADDGPFFAGSKLHVVDLKIHLAVRWVASGTIDHIPATTFTPFAKLNRVSDAVRDHAGVKAWYATKR